MEDEKNILETFVNDYLYYVNSENNTITIQKYIDNDAVVEIPNYIGGKIVTSIGFEAFSSCTSLTSVTIPDSVTSINIYAFKGCTSLQYNEYDNAYYLGNDNNPYVVLIKAKSKDIKSCEINKNCKVICEGAFSGCTSLTSITIPDSVTSIGMLAFSGCESLLSITIPNGVYSICEGAFFGCTSLTSITIPDSVTSIGMLAFSDCESLLSITVPNVVYSIGDDAFSGCKSLTTIYYNDDYEEWKKVFGSDNENLTSATIYFYSESKPMDTTLKYWHYVDGKPTAW